MQTFNDDVGELISRRQDNAKLAKNFQFLRNETGVHIHADLIVGLPGESFASFAAGFNQLLALDPQEIQVGILKRLKGTPITRHDVEWEMVYSQHPPFEILQNKLLDFATITRLRHFARFWDLIGNSGNFLHARDHIRATADSPFHEFMKLSDHILARENRLHGISLVRLTSHVFDFLVEECDLPAQHAAEIIWSDYTRNGRRDRPQFLKPFDLKSPELRKSSDAPRRQAKHLTD